MSATEKTTAESAEEIRIGDPAETEEQRILNPFDCPAGGPVFSDQASEEVCPVCREVGGDGQREGEVLEAFGWEFCFDRYG
jgi:rubrerythrin